MTGATEPPPLFRRATEQEAFQLARSTFLANERVDMQALAAQLGVARATLHRWVHTRENLLDHVLGELAVEFFEQARAQARGERDDRIVDVTRMMVGLTAQFEPLRGFVEREPSLALRLLIAEGFGVRRRLLEGLEGLIADELPGEADQLDGFALAVVQIGTALEWSTLVAGDEPSSERIAAITRALLAGARAGKLPAVLF